MEFEYDSPVLNDFDLRYTSNEEAKDISLFFTLFGVVDKKKALLGPSRQDTKAVVVCSNYLYFINCVSAPKQIWESENRTAVF